MRANLNFVINQGERLLVYPSEGGGRGESKSGEYEDRQVTIEDGRAAGQRFELELEGFTLVAHPTAVTDFYDDAQLPAYEAEVAALLERVCGATEVLIFDHTRRADDPALRRAHSIREPAATAHNDYTADSAPQRIRDLLPAAQAARWLAGRFAMINVWRPMRGPVRRSPLVLCDARSVDREDLVVTERRARARTGEIYQLAFNPRQRWVYFPALRRDEALLFKCFDSAKDGRARFAPHSAAGIPNSAAVPPRESIETRTVVRFAT
jgi:hypothetical protein